MKKLATPVALILCSLLSWSAAQAQQKTAKACEEEWKANKPSIQASGKKKKDFIAECRGQPAAAETRPATPTPTPAPATAPKPAAPTPPPASTASGGQTASPPPINASKSQNPVARRTAPQSGTPAAANEYTSETEAKGRCPTDIVVWANTNSKIYHFAGTADYGRTKRGAYMCERDTASAGFRAAKNEKHP